MLIRVMACGTPACDVSRVASGSVPLVASILQRASTYGAAVATLLHQKHSYWRGLGSLSIVLGSAGIKAVLE